MTNSKISKAFADLDRAESRLARAFTKWMKARAKVRRLDKKFGKALDEKLSGEMDIREMGIKARPWPNKRKS